MVQLQVVDDKLLCTIYSCGKSRPRGAFKFCIRCISPVPRCFQGQPEHSSKCKMASTYFALDHSFRLARNSQFFVVVGSCCYDIPIISSTVA